MGKTFVQNCPYDVTLHLIPSLLYMQIYSFEVFLKYIKQSFNKILCYYLFLNDSAVIL